MPAETIAPALLTVPQCAAYLAVSERTVWNLVKSGKLPAIRLSRKMTRIERGDVDAFISEMKGAL